MRRALTLSPLVAIVALMFIPIHANALSTGPCSGNWPIDQGRGITTQSAGGMTFYVDNRGTSNGVWIYQESNGIKNLQRGGSSLFESDACVDDPLNHPDALIL